MGRDRRDQLAGEGCGGLVPLGFGQMALQDRVGGALAEVGLEDRRQRESTSGASASLPVSLRRHRRRP